MAKGRVEATAEVWRDRVARWKESGLTAKQFAEREGIARPGALSWWRHQLGQAKKDASLQLVRLEPVKKRRRARKTRTEVASAAPSRAPSVEIVCGAFRVIVSHDFDERVLRR